jgi:hypothetical protein
MTPLGAILRRLADALLRVTEEPTRPKEVDAALEQEYDLEAYDAGGGGIAPPDAPHIDDDGTI